MKARLSLLAVVSLVLTSSVAAQQAGFAEKPKAVKAGEGAKITFAVTAATDVEVAILDKDGKVVRHLAAGLLGPKAPPPLAANSLKQELVWDGKDDAGQAAGAGPFKVRVSLGLKPQFDKLIGDNAAALGGVRGFAVGGDGLLFVLHNYGAIHPNDDSGFCSVFSREGKYLRTILPYPADLPDDKLPGVRRIKLPDGSVVPFLYNGELRSVIPGTGEFILHQPTATADGRFVFLGHQEVIGTQSRYNQAGVRQVVVLNSDGSVPAGGPLRTILAKASQCGGSLAAAPDGKTFYAADIADGTGKNLKQFHCVFRFTLDDKEPTPLIGKADEAGAGADKLNAPRSVGVDAKGNIYVSDRGNNRVAEFDAAGKFLGEIKVEMPDRLAVAPNGTIYVTAGLDERDLLKFDSIKAEAPSAKLADLPYFVKGESRDTTMLAVDGSAKTPIVYYGTARAQWRGGFKVLRIEDKGREFGKPEDIAKLADAGAGNAGAGTARLAVGSVLMLSVDRPRNRVYMDKLVYDANSGKLEPGLGTIIRETDRISAVGTKAGNGAVGLDGLVYLMGYSNWLRRYDSQLKPVPFDDSAGKGGALIYDGASSLRLRARGVTADRQGNIYALWQDKDAKNAANILALHGPDGKVKNPKLIDSCMRGLESVRLDYQGNIYVMLSARPRGMVLPADFPQMTDMPPTWKYSINSHQMNWYEMLYGCIVKFAPSGGKIVEGDEGVKMEYGRPGKVNLVAINGAQWTYFGASPAVSWRHPYPDACDCEAAQFDVDGFGRSFFPDAARFRVSMLDSAGNYLGSFGAYGNADARPAALPAGQQIPMYWPYEVAASDDGMVYVGDRLNRQVIAVKLSHAAEETANVE